VQEEIIFIVYKQKGNRKCGV